MIRKKETRTTAKAKRAEVVEMRNELLETDAQGLISPSGEDEQIAALAYRFWIQRGCPIGTAEEDWFRAEDEIKNRKVLTSTAAIGS